jgi:hypothetical protein
LRINIGLAVELSYKPMEQKMDFLHAILDLTFAQLFVAGAIILLMFSGPTVITEEEDDNSDYENASWNPASVNYDE